MISFPVLKMLTIDKYGLFPPSQKQPLVIEFQPGQNAIVGVNGSGKSTLINIALRWGMSRPLLNSAGRALPVDDAMRLSDRPQVSPWSYAWRDARLARL